MCPGIRKSVGKGIEESWGKRMLRRQRKFSLKQFPIVREGFIELDASGKSISESGFVFAPDGKPFPRIHWESGFTLAGRRVRVTVELLPEEMRAMTGAQAEAAGKKAYEEATRDVD